MQAAYLERREAAQNMARFYRVRIETTLFGDFALVREWGRIGTDGQKAESWFPTLQEAESEGARLIERKRPRGYVELARTRQHLTQL